MVNNIFKYGTSNLIILYHCIYSGLLNIIGNVIQNSIGLMRSPESCSQIDK